MDRVMAAFAQQKQKHKALARSLGSAGREQQCIRLDCVSQCLKARRACGIKRCVFIRGSLGLG